MGKAIRNEERFERETFATCRALLEMEKRTVLQRLERGEALLRKPLNALPDEFDDASQQAEQGTLLRLLDKEQKLLVEILHALEKFDQGTYGTCEGTGEAIEPRRLLARPWSRYGLEYREELERIERGFLP